MLLLEQHRTAEQHLVALGVIGGGEFDVHFPQLGGAAGELPGQLQARGQCRVDHEQVEGVVRADRVEARGRWLEAGVAPVVLTGQPLEAHQGVEGLAEGGCAFGGDAGQAEVRGLAVDTHQ